MANQATSEDYLRDEAVLDLNRAEISKIDPKCWLCATTVIPTEVKYGPLICFECLPEYEKRTFLFVRPTQEEMEAIVGFEKK